MAKISIQSCYISDSSLIYSWSNINSRDAAGLRRLLVERKEPFARMLTERLLAYACGRRMEPLDRPAIDAVVAATAAGGWPLRDLIEAVVLSDAFRRR